MIPKILKRISTPKCKSASAVQFIHQRNSPKFLVSDSKKILWKNQRCYSSSDNKGKDSKYGENLSVVLYGVNDLRLENRPVPKFKENQILLQMEVVGICGSDVHYYLHGKIGPFVVKKPMIIGHEASGTVLECGKSVKHLKSGDKVAIEPQIACRMCSYCKSGHYHLCPNLFFCATPPDDGNLSRYYVHDADFCFKLPSNLDLEHGTLMEPLAVGIHCCKRARVTSGDSVLILGAGPIGLVNLLTAQAFGASKTVIISRTDFKLKKAMEMGADYAINTKGCSVENIVKTIRKTLGHKPNKTIECSGAEEAVQVGLHATAAGGKIVLCGLGKDFVKMPVTKIITREIDMFGIFRYVNDYPTAIELVSSGKIDPKPLITHHFKLEDSVKAFKTASDGKSNFIKIMIHANPNWKPKGPKC